MPAPSHRPTFQFTLFLLSSHGLCVMCFYMCGSCIKSQWLFCVRVCVEASLSQERHGLCCISIIRLLPPSLFSPSLTQYHLRHLVVCVEKRVAVDRCAVLCVRVCACVWGETSLWSSVIVQENKRPLCDVMDHTLTIFISHSYNYISLFKTQPCRGSPRHSPHATAARRQCTPQRSWIALTRCVW